MVATHYVFQQVYTKRALAREAGSIPAGVYFDWSEPMVPFSILVAYSHIVLIYILLRVIDVRANGGNIKSALSNSNQ